MIAAKNSFIFNKHSLATLEIRNIPSLIRSLELTSSFGFLFEMPILANPWTQFGPEMDPNSTGFDPSDIMAVDWSMTTDQRMVKLKPFPK